MVMITTSEPEHFLGRCCGFVTHLPSTNVAAIEEIVFVYLICIEKTCNYVCELATHEN